MKKEEQKKCEHLKYPHLVCNKETCDGIEFVHTLHCNGCGEAIPKPTPTDWEKEFNDKFIGGNNANQDCWSMLGMRPDLVKSFIRAEKEKSYKEGKNDKTPGKTHAFTKGYDKGLEIGKKRVVEEILKEVEGIDDSDEAWKPIWEIVASRLVMEEYIWLKKSIKNFLSLKLKDKVPTNKK